MSTFDILLDFDASWPKLIKLNECITLWIKVVEIVYLLEKLLNQVFFFPQIYFSLPLRKS